MGWLPPSTAGNSGDQTHARRRCRVLGGLEATFCCQGRRGSGARPAALLRPGRPGGRLLLPVTAAVRRTSGGAAAPCGRPGGLLQPPGRRGSGTRPAALPHHGHPEGHLQPPVTAEIRRTPGGAAASWASWRPPSAARGGKGQAHVRRCCCALWAAWRPPSAVRAARVRRTSGGTAAPCGRPGGPLQPPGRRGSGARPAALLRPMGGLAASFSRRG